MQLPTAIPSAQVSASADPTHKLTFARFGAPDIVSSFRCYLATETGADSGLAAVV
jgi:hypothetical protein